MSLSSAQRSTTARSQRFGGIGHVVCDLGGAAPEGDFVGLFRDIDVCQDETGFDVEGVQLLGAAVGAATRYGQTGVPIAATGSPLRRAEPSSHVATPARQRGLLMVARTEGETIPIIVIEFGPVIALRSQGGASCQAQPPPVASCS